MKIGIPKEIKNNENRVGMTPAGVAEFIRHGHEVMVQHTLAITLSSPDLTQNPSTIMPMAKITACLIPVLTFIISPPFIKFETLTRTKISKKMIAAIFFNLFYVLILTRQERYVKSSIQTIQPIDFFTIFIPLK
mgnify:CR=1 FL=1